VVQKKWPKRLFWLLSATSFVALISILTPVDYYTDRARVSEMWMLTATARETVERELLKAPEGRVFLDAHKLVPEAIGTKSKDGERVEIAYRNIGENGEIKVYSPQLGALLVLTPTISDKKVVWSCWGRPLSMAPSPCRGDQ
jgi:hypothetical protein